MRYISTQNKCTVVSAAEAVVRGISPEGGLFVPETFPSLDVAELANLSYAEIAEKVLSLYFDFDISGVAQAAYSTFDGEPAPVVKLGDNLFVTELWHGPTLAFKDMALTVLPRLLVRAKAELGVKTDTLILVATSGDTGKAALEGFKDVDGTLINVFYPSEGVSPMQKRSMQTQSGGNVFVQAVDGNFDDTQTAVKRAFTSEATRAAVAKRGVEFSSANSINIGRLVPQIAYYFSSYRDLLKSGAIALGDKVDYEVPTGNFGDILAGYYAKRMGLPVGKLTFATNDNKVLYDCINTGEYDINRPFYVTQSPAMDILISSNFERLLFELSGRDDKAVAGYMKKLFNGGVYKMADTELFSLREAFGGDYVDRENCYKGIKAAYEKFNYLCDPHTAIALSAVTSRAIVHPTVVVSTANAYKFAPEVLKAFGRAGDVNELAEFTCTKVPKAIASWQTDKLRFNGSIAKGDIDGFIRMKYGE